MNVNNTCVVIVTYGNRFAYLEQVIEALFREGIGKIIIVDNNSEESNRKQLLEFERGNKNNLKVIYLNDKEIWKGQ